MTETMALSGSCRTNTKDPGSDPGSAQNSFPDVVELNVGGQVYYTRHVTLVASPNSLLGKIFSPKKDAPTNDLARDPKGRYFIDRDGFLFRYVLDYLRDRQVVLPDHFPEKGRLRKEAEYFELPDLVKLLTPNVDESKQRVSPADDCFHSDHEDGSSPSCPPSSLVPADRKSGFVTVGYRGSCTVAREAQTGDAKFRRVPRILICGRVALAKEVFGETLNESRDPDRTPDRYTSRFYLKFRHLERAFDMLAECGFSMAACNSALTASSVTQHTDDKTWSSYTEYVFYRGSSRWSSPPCCCSKRSHKGGDGEGEGEESGGTSFNELSTSSSDSQSEAGSPQGTVVCAPASRQKPRPPPGHAQSTAPQPPRPPPHAHVQTLDRPPKKGPVAALLLQQREAAEPRRKSDLLRTLTAGARDSGTCKKRAAANAAANEKKALTAEEELARCIRDFRKIKIPERFPERKYMWQADLLRKYRL